MSIDITAFKVGDLITLSSLGVMVDHGSTEITMVIKNKRIYHLENMFHYTGYIIQPEDNDEITYMVLIRQIGKDHDIVHYYLDKDGDVSLAREIVIDESGEDFIDRFDLEITDDKNQTHNVTWDKQQSFHGVDYSDNETEEEEIRSLGTYLTNDDSGGYPYALIEWAGDDQEGWLELWIGQIIKEHEIKFIPTK